ncbi:Soluble pyridine nucleotide transhydrogenase [bacterium HR15]|nr:Soluble pyridine nucleotide transhydrogenase [bacterium HR15]
MPDGKNPLQEVEVLVLGAGLAGSVATYRLQQAGCRVALIEARARVGGACTQPTTGQKGSMRN